MKRIDFLCSLIRGGRLGLARAWMRMVPNLNETTSSGESLIEVVSRFDAASLVEPMLERGWDPAGLDAHGRNAMSVVVEFKARQTLSALLECNVSVDLRNKDRSTALIRASAAGDAEWVSILLEAGAATYIRDGRGRTAADLAVFMLGAGTQCKEILTLLERYHLECEIASGATDDLIFLQEVCLP